MSIFDKLKQTLSGQINTQNQQQPQQQVVEKKLSNAELIEQEVNKFRGKFQYPNFYLPQNGRFNLSKTDDAKIRQFHEISDTTRIYFIFHKTVHKEGGFFSADRDFLYSMLFLENGISFISQQLSSGWLDTDNLDDIKFIKWTDIKDAEPNFEYCHCVNIFQKNSTKIIEIAFRHLNDETYAGLDETDNNNLVKLIENIANNYTDILSTSVDIIVSLIEDEKYDECLNVINQSIEDYGDNEFESTLFYYFQAKCYLMKQEYDKAYKSIMYCQEINKKHEMDLNANELSLYAEILAKQGKTYDSLRIINKAVQKAEKNTTKEEYKDIQKSLTKTLKDDFLNLPSDKRRYIIIGKQFKEYPDRNLIGIQKEFVPQIRFSGVLAENEVYVLHPYLSDVYLPFQNYESLLLVEKFSEFQYIMQCLGAREISIEWRKGKKAEEMTTATNEIGGGATYKGFGATGSSMDNSTSENSNSNKQKIAMHQLFEQTNTAPYLPDNLVWFNYEPRWQQLYQQRLNGSILKDSIVISNENITKGSSTELQELKASLELAVFSANANLKEEYTKKFRSEEKTEWCINVDFYPINKQGTQVSATQVQSPSIGINDNEQKYIDELKFMLEDDSNIDEDERRMLDRKRQKYGISEERALELEKTLMPKNELTSEEQEYINEVKDCAVDGNISEGDKRILQRLAAKLGISEQRAIELENIALKGAPKPYTEEELKYIEEIKFSLEDDSEVSASERRMLNKERDRLGISPERAEEIEQEFIREVKK